MGEMQRIQNLNLKYNLNLTNFTDIRQALDNRKWLKIDPMAKMTLFAGYLKSATTAV